MKIFNSLLVLGMAVLLGFSVVSCETVKPGKKSETKGFLVTKDLGLKTWLNKRFSIRYDSLSPQVIFKQVPFKDVPVQTSNLPTNAPTFSLTSPGLSRRELLKKISDFWDLDMAIHTNAEGNPISISATGKATSSEGS